MINIGKLWGEKERMRYDRLMTSFTQVRSRINHSRDVSRDHAAFHLAPVKLALSISSAFKIRHLQQVSYKLPITSYLFPRVTLSPAHLASLIMGRPRRDMHWVMAPIKQTLRACARVLRDKLFFRSRFSIYRPSSKFSLVSRGVLQFFFVNMLTVTADPRRKSALCWPRKYFNVYRFDMINSDALDDKGDNIMNTDDYGFIGIVNVKASLYSTWKQIVGETIIIIMIVISNRKSKITYDWSD